MNPLDLKKGVFSPTFPMNPSNQIFHGPSLRIVFCGARIEVFVRQSWRLHRYQLEKRVKECTKRIKGVGCRFFCFCSELGTSLERFVLVTIIRTLKITEDPVDSVTRKKVVLLLSLFGALYRRHLGM